jgi:hypothetical protein
VGFCGSLKPQRAGDSYAHRNSSSAFPVGEVQSDRDVCGTSNCQPMLHVICPFVHRWYERFGAHPATPPHNSAARALPSVHRARLCMLHNRRQAIESAVVWHELLPSDQHRLVALVDASASSQDTADLSRRPLLECRPDQLWRQALAKHRRVDCVGCDRLPAGRHGW